MRPQAQAQNCEEAWSFLATLSPGLRDAGQEPGFYLQLLQDEGYHVHETMSASNPSLGSQKSEYVAIRFRVNRLAALTLDWHATGSPSSSSLHNVMQPA